MQLTPLVAGSASTLGAILIKESASKASSVLAGYMPYLAQEVIPLIGVAPLYFTPANKVSVKDATSYLKELLPLLYVQGVRVLYVADSAYFKILSGEKKTDPWRGYALPCKLAGFEEFQVVLGYNHNVLFHNPSYEPYIQTTIDTFCEVLGGGSGRDQNFEYTEHRIIEMTVQEAAEWKEFLLAQPELSLDLEAFSLKFYNAGIGTAAIAWSETEALTFNIDLRHNPELGAFVCRHKPAYEFLRSMLHEYKGKWIFHNASYDAKVLIYEIFMEKDFFNYNGMIKGIRTVCANFEDTKLSLYCATNNAVMNKLSLKEGAHEYVGNYSMGDDIKDITQIPLNDLLRYNGIDAVATFWLNKKNQPILVQDKQEEVYNTILKPSVRLFLQCELVGVPLCMDRVLEAIAICEADKATAIQKIMDNKYLKEFAEVKATQAFDNQHERWKKKRETIDFFRNEFEFNPNSDQQVADFLYNYIGFEAVEFTKGGAPSTSKDALAPLKFQTDDPDILVILEGLGELSEVSIILNNFLTTFRDESVLKPDGNYWLHGSFNIGGTKSGRLSSSDPNLQNLPAKGKYGKLVKSCVVPPKGWLFAGADFASLEDRIDALLTKDTNKIKVYTDGFDGHCLRAAFYFNDVITDVDITSVEQVNAIKERYPDQRDESKAPTFALTYLGTWITLVKNCGFTKEKAKAVEKAYHELYIESDQYKDARLRQAAEDGYATLAFGLRIRCKVMAASIYGSKYMTSAAQAEMRSIGNAFGQSFGMLNNRAGIAVQEQVFDHPEYSEMILPIMHIHDAQYYLIIDNVEVLHYANTIIGKEMSWQEAEEIKHDKVKLFGELDVFYPSWEKKATIPNNATINEILAIGDNLYV